MSSFPRSLAKGKAFPLSADNNPYFMGAMLPEPPELPDERASFNEPFDGTYCVNEEQAQKESTGIVTETQGGDTGVVNDEHFCFQL